VLGLNGISKNLKRTHRLLVIFRKLRQDNGLCYPPTRDSLIQVIAILTGQGLCQRGTEGKNPLSDKKKDNYQQDFADKNPPVGKFLLTGGPGRTFSGHCRGRKNLLQARVPCG